MITFTWDHIFSSYFYTFCNVMKFSYTKYKLLNNEKILRGRRGVVDFINQNKKCRKCTQNFV